MPRFLSLLLASCVLAQACTTEDVTPLADYALIPIPVDMTTGVGAASVANIEIGQASAALQTYLGDAGADWLNPDTDAAATPLTFKTDAALGEGAYRLDILPERMSIASGGDAGTFYGLQTLRQLAEEARENGDGRLASGTVTDQPRYTYRGVMLDIARHFHGPEEIRRVIDLISRYKMNVLHLHLADDQGWRIEIKSWPKLTEIGGSTQVGGKSGGFLTQAEYSDLVAYAKTRHVTIVPEIDMPGHTQAALASYPELNCNPEDPDPQLYEGIEVGFSTFCIGKPVVMEFVGDVIREIAAITPGPYLHIGGDESHSTDSMDYRRFMRDAEAVVRANGKRAVAWDEFATAEADPSAIVQYWHSAENATLARERGHEIIMSPAKYAYLDMQYDSTSRIGLHWAAYISPEQGYSWDPAEVEAGITDEHILGVEAPLWTETVETREDIDYLMFPRVLGYAEIGWTPADKRDWSTYEARMETVSERLESEGVKRGGVAMAE